MHNITVTYTAPKGESKVTEIFGHTFFDGKPETIEVDDRVLGKLKNHPQFKVADAGKAPPPSEPLPDPRPPADRKPDSDHKHK